MFNRAFGRFMLNESNAYEYGVPYPNPVTITSSLKASAGRASPKTFTPHITSTLKASRGAARPIAMFVQSILQGGLLGAVYGDMHCVTEASFAAQSTRRTGGGASPSTVLIVMDAKAAAFEWEKQTDPTIDWEGVPATFTPWTSVPAETAQWKKVR